MIKGRRLGHKHNLTVPTVRKGTGVAQAGRQVIKNKATVNKPGAPMPGDDMQQYANGGMLRINPYYWYWHNKLNKK